MRKEKMFLTEYTEFTEKGVSRADVAGKFMRKRKNFPANFLLSSLSLSVNSSEPCERVRNIRRSSGFTLVELLIVIVLMAIIIGISAPAFIGMGRGAGMRGAVRSVCSTLSLLRQWAITHREEVTFVYFQGSDPGTATNASYYYAVNASGTAVISTNDSPQLPMEVMFDGGGAITFKTDGGVYPGGTSTNITIMDRKVQTVTKIISINGLTGGIKVE